MGKEQRKLKRIQFDSPVFLKLLNERNAVMSEIKGQGTLNDLSASGCAFHHAQRLDKGDRLEMRIELNEHLAKKHGQDELKVRGDIVRVSPSAKGFLISVRFMIDR
jgi:hypothetical protein